VTEDLAVLRRVERGLVRAHGFSLSVPRGAPTYVRLDRTALLHSMIGPVMNGAG
jgi:hypothetical protein